MFIGMENIPEFTFPSIGYFLLINMIPAIISPIMAILINVFSNSKNLVPIFFSFTAPRTKGAEGAKKNFIKELCILIQRMGCYARLLGIIIWMI